MHDVVTTSATAPDLYSSSSEDLLSPISLSTRPANVRWSQPYGISGESSPDIYNGQGKRSVNNRKAPPKNYQKITFPPTRTPSSESDSSQMEPSSIHSKNTLNNNRWRFNGNGQFVDSEAAPAEWDLADEIVRLKIGEVAGDLGDNVHGQIVTPPKSKRASAAVVQLSDGSPLETSSDASADSSPHPSDHQTGVTHSRGSSTSSAHESVLPRNQNLPVQLKVNTGGEAKERPHSFSGGLSAADLRRLQQAGESPAIRLEDTTPQHQQWPSVPFRDSSEQPTYPSLTNSTVFPRSQQHHDPRSGSSPSGNIAHQEDMVDYQRNYNPLSQQQANGGGVPQFPGARPNTLSGGLPYRRGFNPQGIVPTSVPIPGYPGGHHTSHLSLGNAQQLYDMMNTPMHPDNHPAVARVQQQHNVYRPNHHHSASDSAIRDAATLALLNSNIQTFGTSGPGIYLPAMGPPPPQPIPMYGNQFYPGGQDVYGRGADLAAAQAMANRLQPQYTGYGSDDMNGPNGNGPSANNRKLGLYKTELCRSWEEKGTCRYGSKCQFAHGEEELRKVARHPKYKTEICRTFWVSGSCPYGKRCCFIHTELPASGAPPGADGAPPPPVVDGRARSLSTNSDPNADQSISLLARISAKRKEEASGSNGQNSSIPVDVSPPSSGYQFDRRPPTGSLRVDTSVLDASTNKQNKSAYPTFASNVMAPGNDQASSKSPVPVTAGPDLGRQHNARVEIVGYNLPRVNKPTPQNPNVRHSFNGTDVNVDDYNTPTSTVSIQPVLRMASPDRNANGVTPRASGHSRSGSAGNWGSFSRGSHLAAPYPQSSGGNGELKANSPWSTSELAVGSSRLNEKAWA